MKALFFPKFELQTMLLATRMKEDILNARTIPVSNTFLWVNARTIPVSNNARTIPVSNTFLWV